VQNPLAKRLRRRFVTGKDLQAIFGWKSTFRATSRDASLFKFYFRAALHGRLPQKQILKELFLRANSYCTLLRELFGKGAT
jgi:hypothetical protein